MMDSNILKKLPGYFIDVPATKMFQYPSRFIDLYNPSIMEVYLPGYQSYISEKIIKISKGSTKKFKNYTNRRFKTLDKLERYLMSPVDMEGYIYDARFANHWNLSHIIREICLHLLEIKDLLPAIKVILPKNADLIGIKFLKEFEFEVICTNREIIGNIIEIVSLQSKVIPGNPGTYYSPLIFDFPIRSYNKNTPKRIFIPRKGRRKIINEYEVEQYLKTYGFTKVYFEDIPVSEQWSIARNAELVVAPHGSALTNLLFNQKKVKVVELSHPGYVKNCFRERICYVGGTWCLVTGKITDNVLKKIEMEHNYYAEHDMLIDVDCISMAFNYLQVTANE